MEEDQAGLAADGAGDVNGDGRDDLIIGAQDADNTGADSGSAYVIYGRASSPAGPVDLGDTNGAVAAGVGVDAADGFRIDAPGPSDKLGSPGTVAGAGDTNGDGRDDLFVATRSAAYAVYGTEGAVNAARSRSVTRPRRAWMPPRRIWTCSQTTPIPRTTGSGSPP